MLTPEHAERELMIGVNKNDGLWKQHSISVANNARLIAERISGMDCNVAYTMGLLHDIGRKEGNNGILHIFDGYNYMMSINQPEIARICLTHSFPTKEIDTYFGMYNCFEQQRAFLKRYIEGVQYDNYDLLIQLCDAISLPDGACIMEKRLVDVALRHGLFDFTIEKWRAFMNIKKHFDELCNQNIYFLLPNVMENSYKSLI